MKLNVARSARTMGGRGYADQKLGCGEVERTNKDSRMRSKQVACTHDVLCSRSEKLQAVVVEKRERERVGARGELDTGETRLTAWRDSGISVGALRRRRSSVTDNGFKVDRTSNNKTEGSLRIQGRTVIKLSSKHWVGLCIAGVSLLCLTIATANRMTTYIPSLTLPRVVFDTPALSILLPMVVGNVIGFSTRRPFPSLFLCDSLNNAFCSYYSGQSQKDNGRP